MKININTILLIIIAILLIPISLFCIAWFAEIGYKLIPPYIGTVLICIVITILYSFYNKKNKAKDKAKLNNIEKKNEM
ncbi:hypothetical protein [Paenibacillus odorifer]|uniref:Uncharacterized protein n=1 Tax=Paenibacillus odorifer TaxID=189426 RepID=A0A1R0WSD8_9BACL|nr:hypothetical protein [Paenibacillus odorifer]OMD20346.1 hypothetical protein BJP51_09695 [Paenibacillus odorifer]